MDEARLSNTPPRLGVAPIKLTEVLSALLEEQPEYRRLFEEEVTIAQQGANLFNQLISKAQQLSVTRDTLVLQVCARLLSDKQALETEVARLRANIVQAQASGAYRLDSGPEPFEAERRRAFDAEQRLRTTEEAAKVHAVEARQACDQLQGERARRVAAEAELEGLRRKLADGAERVRYLEAQCDAARQAASQREQQQLQSAQVSVQLLEQAQQQLSRSQQETSVLKVELQNTIRQLESAREEAARLRSQLGAITGGTGGGASHGGGGSGGTGAVLGSGGGGSGAMRPPPPPPPASQWEAPGGMQAPLDQQEVDWQGNKAAGVPTNPMAHGTTPSPPSQGQGGLPASGSPSAKRYKLDDGTAGQSSYEGATSMQQQLLQPPQ